MAGHFRRKDIFSIASMEHIGSQFSDQPIQFFFIQFSGKVIDSTCSKLHCIHIALAFLYTLNISMYVCECQFILENFTDTSRRLAGIDAVDLCYSVVLLIKLICVHFFFHSHLFQFNMCVPPVGLKIPIIDAHRMCTCT